MGGERVEVRAAPVRNRRNGRRSKRKDRRNGRQRHLPRPERQKHSKGARRSFGGDVVERGGGISASKPSDDARIKNATVTWILVTAVLVSHNNFPTTVLLNW